MEEKDVALLFVTHIERFIAEKDAFFAEKGLRVRTNGGASEYRDFSGLDLCNIDFSTTRFTNCSFRGARLVNSMFRESMLDWCDFSQTALREASLSRAHASGIKLAGADLSFANLFLLSSPEADISGAQVEQTDP